MFGQTFSEDLGRIGQFVKESHCKIKIWVTSSIRCITKCSIGVALTQNIFLNEKIVYSDTFIPYVKLSAENGRETGFWSSGSGFSKA